MKRVMLFIVFSILGTVAAQSPLEKQDAEVLLTTHTDAAGTKTRFVVTPDQLKQTPEWNGAETPPLSLTDAVAKAKVRLEQTCPDFTNFKLQRVSLSRVSHPWIENRWSYGLSFTATALQNNTGAYSAVSRTFLI